MKYLGKTSDPHDLVNKQYVDNGVGEVETSLTNHINNKSNPHEVTKEQIGLANVDNVKQWAESNHPTTIEGYGITDAAPSSALNALEETVATNETTMNNHISDTNNPHSVTKEQVGLANVDNIKQYSASNPPPYPVTSVNGKSGEVELSASDVGALSDTTFIPTKTSEIENDSDFVSDANYVHTDNNFTSVLKAQIETNESDIANHIADKLNPHSVTKEQIGLENVDNIKQWSAENHPNTISGYDITDAVTNTELNEVKADVAGNTTTIANHIKNVGNPHKVTKAQIGLENVENKSSETIRSEITKANVTDALGYTPPEVDTTYNTGTETYSGLTRLYSGIGTNTDGALTQGGFTTIYNALNEQIEKKANLADLAKVATSGKYSDLIDTPEIPSLDGYATEAWVEGQGYLTEAPVVSVNNKVGNVELSASDVGALSDTTFIPTKTSEIENDSGYITSAQAPVQSVNNKTGVISLTPEDIGAAKTEFYAATLGTTWTSTNGYYTQDVNVAGILATDTPIIDIVTTINNYQSEQVAWSKIFKAETQSDSIKFYASEQTQASVGLSIKVVR